MNNKRQVQRSSLCKVRKHSFPYLILAAALGGWNSYPHFTDEGTSLKEVGRHAQGYKLRELGFHPGLLDLYLHHLGQEFFALGATL